MKLLVKVNGMELTARDRRVRERRIDRLERRIQRFDADPVSQIGTRAQRSEDDHDDPTD